MTTIERVFPSDDLAEQIYLFHMGVVGSSKFYFCTLFEDHGALDEALCVFLADEYQQLNLLAVLLANETPQDQLPPELNKVLKGLMIRPYCGKRAPKAMLICRYAVLLSCAFSTACFRNLEQGNVPLAISAYGKSEHFLAFCMATGNAEFGDGSIRTNAWRGAVAKVANDPKQKDKAAVCALWKEWQKQPSRYKGKAAFARDMLDKYESLESQRVIERWCKEWESVPS